MIQLGANWQALKLSEHFIIKEFIVSEGHPDLIAGITPTPQELERMFYLAHFLLEPVRVRWGQTHITSGLRPAALNQAVGGKDTSQHQNGSGVDFICIHIKDMTRVYMWVKDELGWPGQLFLYPGKHIHAGLPAYGIEPTQKIFV